MDNSTENMQKVVFGPETNLYGKGFMILKSDNVELDNIYPVVIDGEHKNLETKEAGMRSGVLTISEYSWTDEEADYTPIRTIEIVDVNQLSG